MATNRFGLAANLKQSAAAMFPSLWVRWRLMRRPRSAEPELSYLKNFIGRDDVTVDVGANLGLYTRTLSRLSSKVHAFEPSRAMADILQQTAGRNVVVHTVALSDHEGDAELRTPLSGSRPIHSLASLEPDAVARQDVIATKVRCARLDDVIDDDVTFVKVDVEGHELNVLRGARALIERSRPVFLVEAEERHHAGATEQLFEFFRRSNYDGFFVRGRDILGIDEFDARADQDETVLMSNGGRLNGRNYVNNFFFFPRGRRGGEILART